VHSSGRGSRPRSGTLDAGLFRAQSQSGEMKTTSGSNRKVQLGFGAAILALLIVGAASYRGLVVSSASTRWVRHTHDVLETLQDLQFAMQSIESSSRGFVLTGNENYLESYHSSRSRAAQDQAALRGLTVDNAQTQRQLRALEQLAAQEIQEAERVIALRQGQGMEAAAGVLRGEGGQSREEALHAAVLQLQGEERRLLELRSEDARRRLGQSRNVLVLGTLLGLLIAAAAGWSVQHRNTGRGQAEAALRESEEQYRMLLDGVQDHAIFMLDPGGRIVNWNAGAERIQGYSVEQIIGRNFSCLFPAEDIQRGRPQEVLAIAAANGRHEEQGMRVRKDGSRFLANVACTALRDPAGSLRGFTEISRDLSESKESGAKYRGLLEAAPDAMVVVNPGGEIVLLNVQAEKQFGYRRDELVGQQVKNIIPEGFAERLIADGTRSAAEALAQQIGTGIELSGRRKDGSEFPIEIMLSPLESAEGVLVTAAIRDISTRKKAELHLLRKVEELNRSNEELGQFAYIASHDLQEPLRMVASYTQLLSRRYKGKLDADADEFIAFAVDGASRMQRLIQDLLAYSRVGTKGKDLLDTSSQEALQRALLNLRGAIEERGALVTHGPLPPVLADETQLVQLFQNLVGNAIKYQRPGGVPQVHVSVTRSGEDKWMFAVKDNGLGIDPQYFEKIFGMFQRLHKREEFAGTGIGLAICKKIVERHGGNISVESQPGQGSTFFFALARSKMKTMQAVGGAHAR